MTTGLINKDQVDQPHYYYKSWSGSDGQTVDVPGTAKLYVWRTFSGYDLNATRYTWLRMQPLYRDKWPKVPSGLVVSDVKSLVSTSNPRLKQRVVDIRRPLFVQHSEIRSRRVRAKNTFNAYNVVGREAWSVKGKNPDDPRPAYSSYLPVAPEAWETQNLLTSNDQLKALSKLIEQVKGHSFNMGVALGEGRETVQLVVQSCGRLIRSIRALKKGRIDLALRELGTVAKSRHHSSIKTVDISRQWLEIQYGWLPLLSDVYEATNAYAALTEKPRMARFVASQTSKNVFTHTNFNNVMDCETKAVSGRRIIYEATELLSVPRSLGLTDPTVVAWEFVPFGFLADWFLPIGAYLDALATTPHLAGRFLITDKRVNTASWRCSAPSAANVEYRGAVGHSVMTSLVRTPGSSLSVPRPGFTDLSKALSLPHLKNAVALLHVTVLSR